MLSNTTSLMFRTNGSWQKKLGFFINSIFLHKENFMDREFLKCNNFYLSRQGGDHSDLQHTVLDHLGTRGVHCAMWNRKSELEYLRRLVEALFPYILRPQALNSRWASLFCTIYVCLCVLSSFTNLYMWYKCLLFLQDLDKI